MRVLAFGLGLLAMVPAVAATSGEPGPRPAVREPRWPPVEPIEAVPLKGYIFDVKRLVCEGPQCIKPTPYAKYRRSLISAGYMPVKMTPTALRPTISAAESNNTSTDGRCRFTGGEVSNSVT